ncbi:hypothetical protein C5167_032184 [Papaver somniferum]|uniref:Uncharacterized protein n=1 Tax=Papaver somniferum TaxID=3469 RepID=A0A4Y7K9R1_PAPSO|nr:hypothetical protein C5167_032184 [Papaver somniferum]
MSQIKRVKYLYRFEVKKSNNFFICCKRSGKCKVDISLVQGEHQVEIEIRGFQNETGMYIHGGLKVYLKMQASRYKY